MTSVHGLGLLALFVLSSCGSDELVPPTPPRPVIAWKVPAPRPTIVRSFAGSTQAADSAEISFEIPGRVVRVHAVRGRRYEAGKLLAELDVTTYRADLAKAKAESDRSAQELRRIQQLFETDNATRAQFESAMAAQKSAAATLSSAQKRVDDGTLRMPFDGVIGEVLAEEQEVIAAGATVFRLQGEGAMEFEVGIPADVISSIQPDVSAVVRIGSLPGHRLSARVIKISREIARNTTYPVTLVLSSPSALDVRDGLDGEADFELPNPMGPTITVPVEAVVGAPDDTRYVWLIDGGITGKVRRRVVRTGQLRQSSSIEILSGLEPGQRVVIRGVHRLVEGTTVRVEYLVP